MANPAQLQFQVRNNATEVQDFLRDLTNWETDIKKKDETLKKQKPVAAKQIPPVRNAAVVAKTSESAIADSAVGIADGTADKKDKIKAYDYRSWDKYDPDKVIEEQEEKEKTAEEIAEARKRAEAEAKLQRGVQAKEEGNSLFAKGEYVRAVECYARAIECDQSNAVYPANRAMAYIKLKKFEAAIIDCDAAIALDEKYVKAYSRRAACREELKNIDGAIRDFEKVLVLEPTNKEAQLAIQRLKAPKKAPTVAKAGSAVAPPATPVSTTPKAATAPAAQPQRATQPPVVVAATPPVVQPVQVAPRKDGGSAASTKKKSVGFKIEEIDDEHPVEAKRPLKRIPIEEIGFDELEKRKAKKEAPKIEGVEPKQPSPIPSKAPTVPPLASPTADVTPIKAAVKSTSAFAAADSPAAPTKRTPTTSPVPTPASPGASLLPSAPKTSFELEKGFAQLKKDDTALYRYFSAIDPATYKTLFQQSLSSEIFIKIMALVKRHHIAENQPVLPILKNLSTVKRFDVAVMFMSEKEKQVVRDIFAHVEAVKESGDVDEIAALKKLYGLQK